jgi:hypothetical protein
MLQARRAGIFVETKSKNEQAPSGAAYSGQNIHDTQQKMPLLTELRFVIRWFLQTCRADGAAIGLFQQFSTCEVTISGADLTIRLI